MESLPERGRRLAQGGASAAQAAICTMLIHIVRRGDTVYGIARAYGVSAARILTDNGLTASSILVVGQALIITLPAVTYTVRRGDTLTSIAEAYGVSVIVLLQNNPNLIANPTLTPGQTLTIRFRGEKRRSITVNGYAYPHIRRNVLLSSLPYLTYLSIFSYGFRESGALLEPDDEELIRLAYQYRAAPILVLTTMTEDGGFSTERMQYLFYDLGFQNRVLESLVDIMTEKGYVGLDVDFEYIPPEDADAYLGFLGNAEATMARSGFFLNVALAPKTYAGQPGLLYEAQDYGAIGGIADTVLLMTYEWGYTYHLIC